MNFNEVIQHWLQGQINDAVAGHSSRIDRLEQQLDDAKYIIERVKLVEAKASYLEKVNATLNERLMQLEKHSWGEAKGASVQQVPDDKRDAQRYRWLRAQYWGDNIVAVVLKPKDNVHVGAQTYNEDLLDRLIDKEMAQGAKV